MSRLIATILRRRAVSPLAPPRRRWAVGCLLLPLWLTCPPLPAAQAAADTPTPSATASPWRWPLPGRPEVVRGFDPPATPYGPGHRGVDLAGSSGMAVLAAGPGVVGFSDVIAGRGVLTVLHSGGLRTTYEPVQRAVPAGTRVAAGTLVGHLVAGHPGCPRPACLHWGLRRGAVYLDPLSLLRAGPIRLLPLGGTAIAARPVSETTPPDAASGPGNPGPLLATAPAAIAGGAGVTSAFLLARRRRPP